jgi:pimeloyl-ACP methyl ester carboxylesterase
MKVGDPVSLYVPPEGELPGKLVGVAERHISTPTGRSDFREFELTVSTTRPQPLRIWVDGSNRLAEVILPATGITVARSDLSTVMVREELVRNAGDESVFVPMTGFAAGATVTTPTASAPKVRRPAVILVPGFGPEDRDEAVGGVPIFGLVAGAVADAGYLAVRYDHRGIGQSGGRPESATLTDYRDDLIEVVNWVRNRKDVDPKHVALIAYGEGGAVAMLAAAKSDDIKGVGLLAVPGTSGRDYVLEQQTRALAAMTLTDADRAAKIALEHRLIDATISGAGIDQLPAELSHGAEQPIFKSWLLFDPTVAIRKLDQPVLILQGLGDADVPRTHADALATAARARKRPADATRVAVLPNVTHVLTSAGVTTIGLPPLSPDVTQALTAWLHDVFTASK